MVGPFRAAVILACLGQVPGWWHRPAEEDAGPIHEPMPSPLEDPKGCLAWVYNRTTTSYTEAISRVPGGALDSWAWVAVDTVFSTLGWLVFGSSWTNVRSGCSALIRVGTLVTICVVVHYVLALCWPIVTLACGVVLTVFWLLRTLLKCFGRVAYYAKRWSGGVPEATEATFIGPGTGEVPETAELRKLKKGADGERWLLVRRDGETVIFKVQDSSAIRSAGLHVNFEPDTMRGDAKLMSALKGFDKVHLCRHEVCQEDGQHFKLYAVAKGLDGEKYQLAMAAQEAHSAGSRAFGFLWSSAKGVARKAKDYTSESEPEGPCCEACKIRWEDGGGLCLLSDKPCREGGTETVDLLVEDRTVGRDSVALCPKHAMTYFRTRFQLKCAVEGCFRLGRGGTRGTRACPSHEEVAASTPTRRVTPRSRSRIREPIPAKGEDSEADGGLRRRVRVTNHDESDARDFLEDIRDEGDRGKGRQYPDTSPGRTPKSAVQRSLARMGLVNSPDKRVFQTTLEEFMEQLAEGRELNLDEEDIRRQMAAQYQMNFRDLTKALYEQATEEQQKGTKGLTKFLAKWRKQAAATERPSSPARSWTVVESGAEGSEVAANPSKPSTPRSSSQATTPPRGLVTLGAPSIHDDRKAGTGGAEPREESTVMEIAKAIQQQTTELASLVKAQQESSAGQAGTMKGLTRASEELVYLLRACGQYTVKVGDGELGSGLANALLSAQVGASTKLRNAGFRQKVTTRLAVGVAGPYWGTQEKYALSAADFLPCTDAELDQFAVESRSGKQAQEQRAGPPSRYEDWASRVQRQTDVWVLVYGQEWRGVREHAARTLGEWHLGAPHKWPLPVLCEVWEELHWRFCEELKDQLRKIKKLAGRETMTLQDLKFYALMPDEHGNPPLELPRTFDLKYPNGWFMTEVLPRIERRQERMLWKMTWEGGPKARAHGAQAGGGDEKDVRAGGDSGTDKLSVKNLLGPKLTAEESNRAKERAPLDRDGRLLCWGHLTHLGCGVEACSRSHQPLKGSLESLDPAVQMQLLRRGGLKRMRAETKESAWEKIKELREKVAKDKAAKVQDGKDRKRASERAGHQSAGVPDEDAKAGGQQVRWAAPAEMVEIDYTRAEADFADMVKGPDHTVFENVTLGGRAHGGRDGSSAPAEAVALVQEATPEAYGGHVLRALEKAEASDDLYAWAATRVAQDPTLELAPLLSEMSQFGLGELAQEASAILDTDVGTVRAGSHRRCSVGDATWRQDGPGAAVVTIDGESWTSYDYKEEIQMTEELAGLLGVVEAVEERRQCVTKVMAAGALLVRDGELPSLEAVAELGQQMRLEQGRQAKDAEGIMGHPAERVTAVEHELRMYAHDVLKAHHDKDYRALAVFTLEELDAVRFLVLRVDYKGDLLVECVEGLRALVHRGHMTLLCPPSVEVAKALLRTEEMVSVPAMGFHHFWHQRHDQPRVAPGVINCRLCKPPRKSAGGGGWGPLRKDTCLGSLGRCGGLAVQGPKEVKGVSKGPAGPSGLVLREFFAGHGVVTRGWELYGERALEPIELYEDPHRQLGRRATHDLADPKVQQRFLAEVKTSKSNVHWIAAPCTSFCDWNLQNGGTRTFSNPAGSPTPKEAMGNTLSEFGAALFEASLAAGNFPVAESSGTSGRYPKQWHLPAWQRILQRPDVDFIEFDMCAFGLQPLDGDGTQFYRHRTGLAFPRHPPLRQALLRLCPGVSATHQHVALKGRAAGQHRHTVH